MYSGPTSVHAAGSEVAGEAAAGLAATYIVLRDQKQKGDIGHYLTHAKQLYTLGAKYPGSYQRANPTSCLGSLGVRLHLPTPPSHMWHSLFRALPISILFLLAVQTHRLVDAV